MKFLYFTDPHVKGRSPSGRLDDYPKAILRKLHEIIDIAQDNDVEAIFCGGDLFDTPRVSYNLIGDVAEILSRWDKPLYVVPGNHDIFGYNLKSLPHTALGLLNRMGVVKLLTRESGAISFQKGGKEVSVEGQPYYLGIDKDNKNKDYSVTSNAHFRILMPHGMLLPKPFHPSVPCTTIKEVSEMPSTYRPDLILCSHYHPEFHHQEGDVTAINPGALGRLEVTDANRRVPQALLFEWKGKAKAPTVSNIPLQTAEASSEVLNFEKKVQEKQEAELLDSFQEHIQDVADTTNETQAINIAQDMAADRDLLDIFDKMINQNQSEEVVSESFVAEQQRISIKEIELKNFQSHKNTKIDLSVRSNALVGASDSGKTAILRGLKWLLFNKPSGTDFIRHGAKKTSVAITTSHGYTIERYRTPSSAGGYKITDPAGEEKQYEGVGREIPPEVANILQIPLLKVGKNETTFQIAEQLEPPFFLGMSGGDRAQWLGMLTGVNQLDDGIRHVNSELSKNKTIKKKAHENMIETEEVMREKNEQLRKLQKKHGKLMEYVDRLREKEQQLHDLEHYMNELSTAQQTISENKTKVQSIGHAISSLRSKVDDLKDKQQTLRDLEFYMTQMATIHRAKKALEVLPTMQQALPKLRDRHEKLKEKHELMNFVAKAGVNLKRYVTEQQQFVDQQTLGKEKLNELKHQRAELVGEECPVCHQIVMN